MNFDLVDTTNSETVQLPMSLQTGEYPPYARAPIIDGLPLSILWILCQGSLVPSVDLDDRYTPILPKVNPPGVEPSENCYLGYDSDKLGLRIMNNAPFASHEVSS